MIKVIIPSVGSVLSLFQNKNTMETNINNTIEGNPLTVGQLAIAQPGALSVFTKYNIDYCCGGHRTLDDACRRVGLDPEKIKREIYQGSGEETIQALHPETWSSTFLVDFIIQNHHSFVRRSITELLPLLDKVCDAHGRDCIELLQIRECFIDLAEELASHMEKEEHVLFPAIKRLESRNIEDHPLALQILGPVGAMEHEHAIAGDIVKDLRSLSNNYTPPDFACPTFRITYQKLQEFDKDLMIHIHLENNILFERLKSKKNEAGSCSL
jgi:regulator of cell morphogenesis and NO signaling